MDLERWVGQAVAANRAWAAGFGPYDPHPSLEISDERFGAAFAEFTERLADNYPFFHPRYAGQMLKPPHPAAVAGYLAAMLVNPNNHALDGGPATARMEREVTAQLAAMFGFGAHLGHLTTSGTIANLEALFVARELHPGRGIAYSADAHYTHGRMCGLLGVEGHPVAVDRQGRMDLGALEELLGTGRVGTVVLTAGTTGLGAIDPIHGALGLCQRHGARIHVDAAYGGFFTILARAEGAQEQHGAEGAAGQPGAEGAAGQPGAEGAAGQPGAEGAAGQPGAEGAAGQPGAEGAAGQPGAEGAQQHSAEGAQQHSAEGARGSQRRRLAAGRAVAGHPRVRLSGGGSAQARASALRLRRRAVPRSRGGALLPA